jgi:hypothetical protein
MENIRQRLRKRFLKILAILLLQIARCKATPDTEDAPST